MKIRAAISPCPNDIFIFSGLISGHSVQSNDPEFEFSFFDLETLNLGVQASRWDLAKISYANFPFCSDNYLLLQCGGALGKGCGPLLLSNHGGWNKAAEVLVPGKFTTANFLLDFFTHEGESPHQWEAVGNSRIKTYLQFDEIYRRLLSSKPCQGVVIHEMRFTYASDGLHLIRDLGEFWEAETEFPIPLGAVALRKDLSHKVPQVASQVEACIRRSLSWAYLNREMAMDLCRKYSQSLSDAVLTAHIDLYVNAYSMNLGEKGRAAVEYFLGRLNSSRSAT